MSRAAGAMRNISLTKLSYWSISQTKSKVISTFRKVYWTDLGSVIEDRNPDGVIESMNLDGSKREIFLKTFSSPTGITLDHESKN